MTALAAQGLVCGGRRRGTAAVRVVHVVFLVLLQLLEEKGTLESHLLDAAVQPCDALARAIVVLFNVGDAAAELDAFSVVSGFDRGREFFLREGARWDWEGVSLFEGEKDTGVARRVVGVGWTRFSRCGFLLDALESNGSEVTSR